MFNPIFQRVFPEIMKESFHNLRKSITSLNTFMHFITDGARNGFTRVDLALDNLLTLVVRNDFELLNHILNDYFVEYVPYYGHVVDRIEKVMDETMVMLSTVVNQRYPAKVYTVQQTIKGHICLLLASLNELSSMNSGSRSRRTETIPSRSSSDWVHFDRCRTFETNITNILQELAFSNGSGTTFGRLDETPLSNSDMNTLYKLCQMFASDKCVGDLPLELITAARATKQINLHILQAIDIGAGFDDNTYLNNKQDILRKLLATAAWFSEQLAAYSRGRTTKIELAKVITQSLLSDTERTLDLIITAMERTHITQLLSKTNEVLRNVKVWYKASLNAITALVPFYDNNGIEDRLRNLQIWRHPIAMLETAEILQFQYSVTDSWRSWGLSIRLEDFVLRENATTMISTAIDQYRQILQSEIIQIRRGYKRAKDDVVEAIKNVMKDFANVYRESLMDSKFVR